MQKQKRRRLHRREARRVALRRAPGTERRAGAARECAQGGARPVNDGDGHEVGDRAPMAPAMELNEVVRAHDPHEMDAWRAAPEPSEGLICKARADAGLDVRYADARAG